MSLDVQEMKDKFLKLMEDVMVKGESTATLISDTGLASYLEQPYLEDRCARTSTYHLQRSSRQLVVCPCSGLRWPP